MQRTSIILALLAAFSIATITPAQAITSSQRVQILKYYQCLGQKVYFPWIICTPPATH